MLLNHCNIISCMDTNLPCWHSVAAAAQRLRICRRNRQAIAQYLSFDQTAPPASRGDQEVDVQLHDDH